MQTCKSYCAAAVSQNPAAHRVTNQLKGSVCSQQVTTSPTQRKQHGKRQHRRSLQHQQPRSHPSRRRWRCCGHKRVEDVFWQHHPQWRVRLDDGARLLRQRHEVDCGGQVEPVRLCWVHVHREVPVGDLVAQVDVQHLWYKGAATLSVLTPRHRRDGRVAAGAQHNRRLLMYQLPSATLSAMWAKWQHVYQDRLWLISDKLSASGQGHVVHLPPSGPAASPSPTLRCRLLAENATPVTTCRVKPTTRSAQPRSASSHTGVLKFLDVSSCTTCRHGQCGGCSRCEKCGDLRAPTHFTCPSLCPYLHPFLQACVVGVAPDAYVHLVGSDVGEQAVQYCCQQQRWVDLGSSPAQSGVLGRVGGEGCRAQSGGMRVCPALLWPAAALRDLGSCPACMNGLRVQSCLGG